MRQLLLLLALTVEIAGFATLPPDASDFDASRDLNRATLSVLTTTIDNPQDGALSGSTAPFVAPLAPTTVKHSRVAQTTTPSCHLPAALPGASFTGAGNVNTVPRWAFVPLRC